MPNKELARKMFRLAEESRAADARDDLAASTERAAEARRLLEEHGFDPLKVLEAC